MVSTRQAEAAKGPTHASDATERCELASSFRFVSVIPVFYNNPLTDAIISSKCIVAQRRQDTIT